MFSMALLAGNRRYTLFVHIKINHSIPTKMCMYKSIEDALQPNGFQNPWDAAEKS